MLRTLHASFTIKLPWRVLKCLCDVFCRVQSALRHALLQPAGEMCMPTDSRCNSCGSVLVEYIYIPRSERDADGRIIKPEDWKRIAICLSCDAAIVRI